MGSASLKCQVTLTVTLFNNFHYILICSQKRKYLKTFLVGFFFFLLAIGWLANSLCTTFFFFFYFNPVHCWGCAGSNVCLTLSFVMLCICVCIQMHFVILHIVKCASKNLYIGMSMWLPCALQVPFQVFNNFLAH